MQKNKYILQKHKTYRSGKVAVLIAAAIAADKLNCEEIQKKINKCNIVIILKRVAALKPHYFRSIFSIYDRKTSFREKKLGWSV